MSLHLRKSIAPLKIFRDPDILNSKISLPDQQKTPSLTSFQLKHNRVKSNTIPENLGSLALDSNENLMTERSLTGSLNKNQISISKQDLTGILKEIKQEILEETVNKNDKFIHDVTLKHGFLDNKVAFTKDEIRQMLKDYKQKISQEITHEKKERMNTEATYYQNYYSMAQQYNQFQSILWYYYMYNPELYRQLIDEYNHRLHNQLLSSLGLSEQFSNKLAAKEKQSNDTAVKFNVSLENNENKEEVSPKIPGKSIIRKSIYLPQNNNADLLSKKQSIGSLNNRKSIYVSENPETNGNAERKSLYLAGKDARSSTLQLAGKNSIIPSSHSLENPTRVRKKSVMPSKEQREALRLADEMDDQPKSNARNSNYIPFLPGRSSIIPSSQNLENLARIRKKSVMPSKEQREAFKAEDEKEEQPKIYKRNTKYTPLLGGEALRLAEEREDQAKMKKRNTKYVPLMSADLPTIDSGNHKN